MSTSKRSRAAEDLKAARKYNGRSRVCARCENRHFEFMGTCCAICSREFIRGFRMGVKWQKEREKEDRGDEN